MSKSFPIADISKDLEKANNYKSRGEIGRSRVSARIAAGKAVRYWFVARGLVKESLISPFQALELSRELSEFPENVRDSIKNLTRKVNYDYSFPDEIDLLKDAGIIIDFISNKVADD